MRKCKDNEKRMYVVKKERDATKKKNRKEDTWEDDSSSDGCYDYKTKTMYEERSSEDKEENMSKRKVSQDRRKEKRGNPIKKDGSTKRSLSLRINNHSMDNEGGIKLAHQVIKLLEDKEKKKNKKKEYIEDKSQGSSDQYEEEQTHTERKYRRNHRRSVSCTNSSDSDCKKFFKQKQMDIDIDEEIKMKFKNKKIRIVYMDGEEKKKPGKRKKSQQRESNKKEKDSEPSEEDSSDHTEYLYGKKQREEEPKYKDYKRKESNMRKESFRNRENKQEKRNDLNSPNEYLSSEYDDMSESEYNTKRDLKKKSVQKKMHERESASSVSRFSKNLGNQVLNEYRMDPKQSIKTEIEEGGKSFDSTKRKQREIGVVYDAQYMHHLKEVIVKMHLSLENIKQSIIERNSVLLSFVEKALRNLFQNIKTSFDQIEPFYKSICIELFNIMNDFVRVDEFTKTSLFSIEAPMRQACLEHMKKEMYHSIYKRIFNEINGSNKGGYQQGSIVMNEPMYVSDIRQTNDFNNFILPSRKTTQQEITQQDSLSFMHNLNRERTTQDVLQLEGMHNDYFLKIHKKKTGLQSSCIMPNDENSEYLKNLIKMEKEKNVKLELQVDELNHKYSILRKMREDDLRKDELFSGESLKNNEESFYKKLYKSQSVMKCEEKMIEEEQEKLKEKKCLHEKLKKEIEKETEQMEANKKEIEKEMETIQKKKKDIESELEILDKKNIELKVLTREMEKNNDLLEIKKVAMEHENRIMEEEKVKIENEKRIMEEMKIEIENEKQIIQEEKIAIENEKSINEKRKVEIENEKRIMEEMKIEIIQTKETLQKEINDNRQNLEEERSKRLSIQMCDQSINDNMKEQSLSNEKILEISLDNNENIQNSYNNLMNLSNKSNDRNTRILTKSRESNLQDSRQRENEKEGYSMNRINQDDLELKMENVQKKEEEINEMCEWIKMKKEELDNFEEDLKNHKEELINEKEILMEEAQRFYDERKLFQKEKNEFLLLKEEVMQKIEYLKCEEEYLQKRVEELEKLRNSHMDIKECEELSKENSINTLGSIASSRKSEKSRIANSGCMQTNDMLSSKRIECGQSKENNYSKGIETDKIIEIQCTKNEETYVKNNTLASEMNELISKETKENQSYIKNNNEHSKSYSLTTSMNPSTIEEMTEALHTSLKEIEKYKSLLQSKDIEIDSLKTKIDTEFKQISDLHECDAHTSFKEPKLNCTLENYERNIEMNASAFSLKDMMYPSNEKTFTASSQKWTQSKKEEIKELSTQNEPTTEMEDCKKDEIIEEHIQWKEEMSSDLLYIYKEVNAIKEEYHKQVLKKNEFFANLMTESFNDIRNNYKEKESYYEKTTQKYHYIINEKENYIKTLKNELEEKKKKETSYKKMLLKMNHINDAYKLKMKRSLSTVEMLKQNMKQMDRNTQQKEEIKSIKKKVEPF